MNLNIEKIEKQLKTQDLARNIIYYERIGSTQDEAKNLSNSGVTLNGTYVVADVQLKGKGTHDRKWYGGEYENISGTFILNPECNIRKLSGLTLMIAECIVNSIYHKYGIKLEIKNPNDIMYKGKKIAGILTESVSNKEIVQVLYIGIGMNINQTEFDSEIKDIATSLKIEFNKDFTREDIIADFCNEFEPKYIEMLK